ncbi:DUF1415 domain-containing protein [Neolewinella lacunae]|uniref:DUF1415 domain-containing protein n=1 Tax=Neolewinella lacunae TaxID=1517758 RepID=A0A923PIC1_9BACT|nr:DUF1415 domain-containing protein [Neolewinella lacunae]MBC6994688.1 DUF1415 domain-containing protein [Neolewinella lacunae]MDN3634560.1 DUF1415 domain-containing protein [Neolewinella lacunae]
MNPVVDSLAWVRDFVIQHTLCPFAAQPFAAGRVLATEIGGSDLEACFNGALAQVQSLLSEPAGEVETTLIVFSEAMEDFTEFMDFVYTFEDTLAEVGADQLVQLAHFHPRYRFEGTADDDPGNRTNRSPYPMLQLLRVESVARAIAAYPDVNAIPARNIRKMEELGKGE